MDLYIVWAYRYGDMKGYNFLVGVFDSPEKAESAATNHRQFRGGKYNHTISKVEANKEYDVREGDGMKHGNW